MKRLAGILAVLTAILWSVAVWGGYVLLGATGAFVAQNAGMFGLPPDVVAWAHYLFQNFGQGTAIVLWVLGVGLIGVVYLIVGAVAGRIALARPRFEETAAPRVEPRPVPPAPPSAPGWGRNASGR